MNIPSKSQLTLELKKAFSDTKAWINNQPEIHFNMTLVTGKWTIAEHLYHLIKSTKAVSNGMKIPKSVLLDKFGTPKKKERTFEELKEAYETALANIEVVVPNNYKAEEGRQFQLSEMIQRFDSELHELLQVIEIWNEEDLNQYLMPHPILGNFTIREFLYFTIFHTNHHLNTYKEKYE